MRKSKNGVTVGITLRLPQAVLEAYDMVAQRANGIALAQGSRVKLSAQDVMRHRLQSMPFVKNNANAKKKESGE
jgi:hypothetical protein